MDENKSSLLGILVKVVIALGVLVLLALIAIPNFVGSHHWSGNACINNLRQIDAAKKQWALENHVETTNRIKWSDVKPYLGRGKEGSLTNIFCPLDSTKDYLNSYKFGDLQTKPKCKKDPAMHVIK